MTRPEWCSVVFNGDCFVAYDGVWYGWSDRPSQPYTEDYHRGLINAAMHALAIEPDNRGNSPRRDE